MEAPPASAAAPSSRADAAYDPRHPQRGRAASPMPDVRCRPRGCPGPHRDRGERQQHVRHRAISGCSRRSQTSSRELRVRAAVGASDDRLYSQRNNLAAPRTNTRP